jgi:hypothetical protein
VNRFTASADDDGYSSGITLAQADCMVADFKATMTEADFKRPLLDAAEDRLAREIRGDADLSVEGLADSLLSRLIRLVSGGGTARS